MSTKRDKDGFLILKRAEEPAPHKKKKKHKKEKEKKPKINFKKGGWKWSLWRKIKDWRTSKWVHKFHADVRSYAVYYPHEQQQVPSGIVAKGGLTDAELNYLNKNAHSPIIFIPIGGGNYTAVSPKAYKKLQTIKKVAIHFKLTVYEDDMNEPPRDIDEFEDVYDNMTSLLGFINYHRQMVLGVYQIQANWCCGPSHLFTFHIMVYSKNGKIKTYTDINDFLLDYHLNTI